MNAISTLILFPLIASIIIFFTTNDAVRNVMMRVCAFITATLTLIVVVQNFKKGLVFTYPGENIIDYVMALTEVCIAAYVIITGIRNKKYIVSIFSGIQTPLILWFEFTQKHGIEVTSSIVFDKLTAIMVLIVGIVGSLIGMYAVGYMNGITFIIRIIKKENESFLLYYFYSCLPCLDWC